MILYDKLIDCYNGITPFQAAISLSLIFLYILYLFVRDLDVPPGPRGSPVFGYWLFLKSATCHLQLQELGRKYGDVFSFRASGKLFIHLGSIKAIKEAHITKSECFEGRFTDYHVLTMIFKDGVAFLKGEPWKVLRKFFSLKFKEVGLNAVRENALSSVYGSLKETVDELHGTKGRPIKITELVTKKCLKIIRRIVFNDQVITNAELEEMNELYDKMTTGMTSTNFLLMGNFAKYCILPFVPSCWLMKRCNKRLEKILSDVIKKHTSEYDENNIRDLIDSYIKERDDRRRKGDPTAAYFTDSSLLYSMSQFVTDGVLTVAILIGVLLSMLVDYPDEQEKIYEEIMEVIGANRLPNIEDKPKLPYTNAFMNEVMRFTDFFPLFPSLECSKDTMIHGYKIPQGSITLINFFSAHRDPEAFENPDEFNPSRYMKTPRPPLPILFGVGKRSCIGEAFSVIQAFLFVVTIVQNFRLSYSESSRGSDSSFCSKERLQICAYPRSQK